MAILVTGSSGHLGEAILRRLRKEGRPARGLDRQPSSFTDRVGDICDREFVDSCMAGVTWVIHAATLHKPHLATHSHQDFLRTNVTGTLTMLEAAEAAGCGAMVFTSTTSTFGMALAPPLDLPAAWITEAVTPIPKNIYGASKLAAEVLCELFANQRRLPVIALRVSRFFPEADDDDAIHGRYGIDNAQANELLSRRVDLEDVVEAHFLALDKAPVLGFRRYIISATTPFTPDDLVALRRDAAAVVHRLFPECRSIYQSRGWTLFPRLDRVYVNEQARRELGWTPRYGFKRMLAALRDGVDFRSPLARAVGSKGYHDRPAGPGNYQP